MIEELNSRALLGNCLLGAGAERADVISEPGAAAPQPRAPHPSPHGLLVSGLLSKQIPQGWQRSTEGEQSVGCWRGAFMALRTQDFATVEEGS